ncbi:chorismate mutase [Caloramator sp. mosi_1]|uniref:chorismate mutase n=1 Tax=Caloramator sp. mosi_1 TaxID=3023090 RepID=UPI002361A4DD|nr:chorismate mutase [Caloramator sp. mosi_1]WDC83818.1 chorismate mutase [Caloramator sp. mosi_1]
MFAIRGATTVEKDERDQIIDETEILLKEMILRNNISIEDIISIIFTATRDLKSAYPAEAARNLGIKYAGLLCFQEMYVENSLEKCIRVLMYVNGEKHRKKLDIFFLKSNYIKT